MAHRALNVILVILVILVIISGVTALWMRNDLVSCENNESSYCPQYVCSNGEPATRTGSNGEIQKSS